MRVNLKRDRKKGMESALMRTVNSMKVLGRITAR